MKSVQQFSRTHTPEQYQMTDSRLIKYTNDDDFETVTADDRAEFTPLPAGKYIVDIVKVSIHRNDAKAHAAVLLDLVVTGTTTDDSYAGRHIFHNATFKSTSPEAVRIGRSQLSAIASAVGLRELKHPNELVGGSLTVGVRIVDDIVYGAKNTVHSFYATK
jgi:hypothetical protein